MERGFFAQGHGYWQTIDDPSDDAILGYPAGTVEVPLRPSHLHTWNGTIWEPPSAEVLDVYVGRQVREERNARLLRDVDPIVTNPFRWADLGSAGQQAWAKYRQALLEVPKQPGFPHQVEWPTKPEQA